MAAGKENASDWIDSLRANTEVFRETRRENRKLVAELKAARAEQRRLIRSIHEQLGQKPRVLRSPLVN